MADKTYDADFYEIDQAGNRTTGEKDWGAWNNAQAPQGGTSTDTGPDPWSGSSVAPTPTVPDASFAPLKSNVMNTLNTDVQNTGVVNQQDPAYQQQVQSNQLQTNLAADRARAAMAQRRAATGTGTSGAVDTDANKVLEQQAFQDKTFEGNLLDKFRQQNLDQKARALTLGSGMLTAEQERQLRGELTREGYDVQRDLSADQLNYQRDALGQQLALSQAGLDQQAMMALLGG
jgi:hypothetical protein